MDCVTTEIMGEGRRPLKLDLFSPDKPNGVAIILLHGGGWVMGSREMVHGNARALAKLGFTCAAVEYRLLHEAPWPSQIDDVRDHIRWMRTNADRLGIDAAKVALQGYSAGAHLALIAAGTQPGTAHEGAIGQDCANAQVAAVVSFFAPARLDRDPDAIKQPPLALLVGDGGMEAARAASPATYIGPGFPTTFIIGGMADYMQPLPAGLDFLNAFVQAGCEVEFHYFHSQYHEFPNMPGMTDDVMAEVGAFYRRTLIDRDSLVEEAKRLNPFARASSPQEFMQMMQSAAKPPA